MDVVDKINEQVSIVDIAKEFDISLQQCMAGNFSHKCKCPNPDHKGGAERTPSCYLSEETNSFYCFGCGAGTRVINFYMLCSDTDFKQALSDLSKRVDLNSTVKRTKRKVSNFSIMLEISNIIRNYTYNNPDSIDKILKLCERVDKEMEAIEYYDITGATKLLSKVKKVLNKRRDK